MLELVRKRMPKISEVVGVIEGNKNPYQHLMGDGSFNGAFYSENRFNGKPSFSNIWIHSEAENKEKVMYHEFFHAVDFFAAGAVGFRSLTDDRIIAHMQRTEELIKKVNPSNWRYYMATPMEWFAEIGSLYFRGYQLDVAIVQLLDEYIELAELNATYEYKVLTTKSVWMKLKEIFAA